MFVNRIQELETLEQRYQSGQAEFFVLYGRRRVGKSELLRHFCRDKAHIFYVADLGTPAKALEDFTHQVSEYALGNPDTLGAFPSWDAGLEFLVKNSPDDRLIVVLDEFTYLVDTDSAMPSIFQRIWDTQLKDANIMLVLCGSYVGLIEKHVLARRSPLYGRRTGQWKLEPLTFWDINELLPETSTEDLVRTYAVLGGIPLYVQKFRDDVSLLDNIEQAILTPGTFLYEEARFLLLDELRDPNRYFSILEAISSGNTKVNDIAQSAKIESSNLSYYLNTLERLGLVERKVPTTERKPEKSKQGIYQLKAHYLRFWFRFVYPNRSLIERGRADRMRQIVDEQLEAFVGPVFEQICQEYLWKDELEAVLGFLPERIGSWWNRQEEIDIVAFNDTHVLWGECKWTNRPVGMDLLTDLKRKVEFAERTLKGQPKWKSVQYALFSRSGFTDGLRQYAKSENVLLFGLDEIVSHMA